MSWWATGLLVLGVLLGAGFIGFGYGEASENGYRGRKWTAEGGAAAGVGVAMAVLCLLALLGVL